ncbi:MAG: hypothetical protein A2583_04420 [Bdellovibrionales bacterium RIFOXYD1_FULL_53_11]|nr:MAG: hypothetical protein A2583_04420 [Bdellovibrionales bacterium RIFOXYD1_FULL_53_11]
MKAMEIDRAIPLPDDLENKPHGLADFIISKKNIRPGKRHKRDSPVQALQLAGGAGAGIITEKSFQIDYVPDVEGGKIPVINLMPHPRPAIDARQYF